MQYFSWLCGECKIIPSGSSNEWPSHDLWQRSIPINTQKKYILKIGNFLEAVTQLWLNLALSFWWDEANHVPALWTTCYCQPITKSKHLWASKPWTALRGCQQCVISTGSSSFTGVIKPKHSQWEMCVTNVLPLHLMSWETSGTKWLGMPHSDGSYGLELWYVRGLSLWTS